MLLPLIYAPVLPLSTCFALKSPSPCFHCSGRRRGVPRSRLNCVPAPRRRPCPVPADFVVRNHVMIYLVSGVPPEQLYDTVCKQEVEIVLTAHSTQINRRTLQYKHLRIAHLLEFNERPDLSHEDKEMLIEDLVREITAIWQTDELRRHKPTPVDEARAGLHIVEQSLWKAVPHYLRRVSNALKKHTGSPLPLTCTPIKFGSWMGGDRDGNPNVTAKVTRDVSLLSRWMAIDLYIRELESLSFELSVKRCSDKLASLANDILLKESAFEDLKANTWDHTVPQNITKLQHSLALPAQLPSGADLPLCTECSDGEYKIRIINQGKFVLTEDSTVKDLDDAFQDADTYYQDIGGCDIQTQEIREAVELPLTHHELYKQIGIDPPRGVLLYGPPGTGKTMLAKAVAHHTTAAFIRVVSSEFVQKYLGELSENWSKTNGSLRSLRRCSCFGSQVDQPPQTFTSPSRWTSYHHGIFDRFQ